MRTLDLLPRLVRLLGLLACTLTLTVAAEGHGESSGATAPPLELEQDGPRAKQPGDGPKVRLPVPTELDREAELTRLRAELPQDFQRLSPARRKDLVDKLLGLASKAQGTSRYAALFEALEQSLAAADHGRTETALARLADEFTVDEDELRTDALVRLGPRIQSSAAEAFAEQLLAHIERCLDEGRLSDVERLLANDVQKSSLLRSSNPQHKADVKALRAELAERRAMLALEERQRADPDDFTVRLQLGRHYAFGLLDFERGFELLAGGSDETLRELAGKERSNPDEAEACFALAQRWQSWSEHERDPRASNVGTGRARHWSVRALELGFDDSNASDEVRDFIARELRPRSDAETELEAAPARRKRSRSSQDVRRAVEGGVDWLLAAQSPDGRWSCADHGGDPHHDVGVTGLALLALLASGDTRADTALDRGVAWLIKAQQPQGAEPDGGRLIGRQRGHTFLYDHAIATLVLCRVLRSDPQPGLADACAAAVRYIGQARNPSGAWRYDVPPTDESDTSVTGWMVVALKAAERAGIAIDPKAYAGALGWLNEVTDPDSGRCGYDSIGSTSSRVEGRNDDYPVEDGEAMTAVALLCRFLMGQDPRTTPAMKQHAELILKSPPEWNPAVKANDMYYWYYGSFAMYRMGGKHWAEWSRALKVAFVEARCTAGPRKGSWDPLGPWGWCGGRVYSTAMAVLSLTVDW